MKMEAVITMDIEVRPHHHHLIVINRMTVWSNSNSSLPTNMQIIINMNLYGYVCWRMTYLVQVRVAASQSECVICPLSSQIGIRTNIYILLLSHCDEKSVFSFFFFFSSNTELSFDCQHIKITQRRVFVSLYFEWLHIYFHWIYPVFFQQLVGSKKVKIIVVYVYLYLFDSKSREFQALASVDQLSDWVKRAILLPPPIILHHQPSSSTLGMNSLSLYLSAFYDLKKKKTFYFEIRYVIFWCVLSYLTSMLVILA